MPITLFIINKLNFKIGVGDKFAIDKTNIYHVMIISLFGSITFVISQYSLSLLDKSMIVTHNYYKELIGGIFLILTIKAIINIPFILRKLLSLKLKV